VFVVCLWLLVPRAEAATVTVDCDAGSTIGGTLSSLKAGDILVVSGTCKENVTIPAEVVRITLDGQGKATVQGVRPAAHTILVMGGQSITIKGCTLTGGRDGLHLSGPASVVVDGNIIQNNGRGIHLDKGSLGRIINNTIQNNRGAGINLIENSFARIGVLVPPETAANTIQDNGGHGIRVGQMSSARIVGNTIANNQGSGVAVDRNSQVDVTGNTINGNRGDGIAATHGSGVTLKGEGILQGDRPNQTDPALKNGGVGIRCAIGGYVEGPIGTLIGVQGAKEFDTTCIERLSLP